MLGSAFFGVLALVVPGELVPAYYLAFAALLVLPMATSSGHNRWRWPGTGIAEDS